MIVAIFVIMFGLLLLGFPMLMSLTVAAIFTLVVYYPDVTPIVLIQQMISGVSVSVLLAVPLFIFAADLMTAGNSSRRLLNLISSFVRHINGGLAVTTGATSLLFGAITGSTQATMAAVGPPMKEVMDENGYHETDAIGVIMNNSSIALLVPPSVVMIMYCVVSGTSVAELFVAGVGPASIMFFSYSLYSYVLARIKKTPRAPKATWTERKEAFKKALIPLGFPLLIIGGIYSGLFSPVEAASIAVLYAVIVEVLIFKTLELKQLPQIARTTGLLTATVFILVAAGNVFSWVISYAQLPQALTSSLLGDSPSQLQVLFWVTIFFFVGCMFADQFVVILILTPIFFPIAQAVGINAIHLGLIIAVQSAIGSTTPPFGCNIFTASAIFNKPYMETIRGLPPYLLIQLSLSAIFVLFPNTIMFFHNLIS